MDDIVYNNKDETWMTGDLGAKRVRARNCGKVSGFRLFASVVRS